MGVTKPVFELLALEAKIKGVFDRLYCCYGNLLCHEDYHNLFTNDWAFVQDTFILTSTDIHCRVIVLINQSTRAVNRYEPP